MTDADDAIAGGNYAFPFQTADCLCTGMTLRDWFAGKIIGELVGAALLVPDETMPPNEKMARAAYALADAMLAERSKL